MEKINKKIRKAKVIIQEKTHIFVFSLPIIILLFGLLYIISGQNDTNIYIYIAVVVGIFIKSLSLFYKKKLILTENKIYLYVRGKKVICWSLVNDFYIVNYSQSFMGKIFDFGTLSLVNKEKELYDYYYLNNPKKVYSEIIKTYETLMKKLDPSFIVTYIDNDSDEIDKIDKIKE